MKANLIKNRGRIYSDLEEILLEAEKLGIRNQVLDISTQLLKQNPTMDFNIIVADVFNGQLLGLHEKVKLNNTHKI